MSKSPYYYEYQPRNDTDYLIFELKHSFVQLGQISHIFESHQMEEFETSAFCSIQTTMMRNIQTLETKQETVCKTMHTREIPETIVKFQATPPSPPSAQEIEFEDLPDFPSSCESDNSLERNKNHEKYKEESEIPHEPPAKKRQPINDNHENKQIPHKDNVVISCFHTTFEPEVDSGDETCDESIDLVPRKPIKPLIIEDDEDEKSSDEK